MWTTNLQLLKMSEGEHKFTWLRGLAEEEPLWEKLQKTNRKFIQLRRLVEANLRICRRWHGVSPYRYFYSSGSFSWGWYPHKLIHLSISFVLGLSCSTSHTNGCDNMTITIWTINSWRACKCSRAHTGLFLSALEWSTIQWLIEGQVQIKITHLGLMTWNCKL